MAVIIHTNPCSPRPPALRVLPGGRPRGGTAGRRWRGMALVVAAGAVVVAVSVLGWMALEAYAPPPPARMSTAAPAPDDPRRELATTPVVVVRPGDSLWSIARRLHPHGDPRPVVTGLARFHGSGPLQPGERLPVP